MCSLTGVYGLEAIADEVLFKGAYSQQHRGEDGVGVALTNGTVTFCRADMGLVGDRLVDFLNEGKRKLGGSFLAAIAHTRYPTEGECTAENAQPFEGETRHGYLAYGHNGELTNFQPLKRKFLQEGIILKKSSDSEMFLASYASANGKTLEEILGNAASQLHGAYSIVGITGDTLFGIRDPLGFKPLSLARLNGGYILSSETTAFLDIEGAAWIGDVKPGTVVTISPRGVQEYRFAQAEELRPCIFEHVYFARPDSHIAGRNVHLVRVEFGKQLYREHPVKGDVVVAVEDSGRSAAEGLADESGIPLRRGLIRNHYIGRTFIRPADVLRDRGVNLKLTPVPEVLAGKIVLLTEDSIVRGNTARSRVRLVRQAGAQGVYLYVSSPQIIGDCLFGIDFHKPELRATTIPDDEEFRRQIGVDGFYHLSLQGMYDALARVPLDSRARIPYASHQFCTGCMSGHYSLLREP